MTTTAPAPLVPVVSFTKRAPVGARWPAAQRAEVEKRLAALGTTITELSDTRQRLGLERLSDATPAQRAAAHHLLASTKGRAAIAAVRAERASLLEGLDATDRLDVQHARALLNVRGSLSELRLGELRAFYAQANLCRIAREG